MEPNEELLAALALGAEGFTKWFSKRIAFSFEAEDGRTGRLSLREWSLWKARHTSAKVQ